MYFGAKPAPPPQLNIQIPEKHLFLLNEAAPIKGLYGGRGGAKSHSIARSVIVKALERKRRILCAREFQTSIKDSVHYLLASTIFEMGAASYFDIQKSEIRCLLTNSEIFYRGLARNIQEIKSMEALDLAWLEEAQSVSDPSWETLIPTLRRDDSEIWASWNPLQEDDPTQERLVNEPMARALAKKAPLCLPNGKPYMIVKKVGWQDNPFFPAKLQMERLHMLEQDPDAYDHVWEGHTRKITAATIFRGKYEVVAFETPEHARFFHGGDWGFAADPTVAIRCFLGPLIEHLGDPEYSKDESCLYIDREVYAFGLEMEDIPPLFATIETIPKGWPMYGDSSRPETISYVRRHGGFNLEPAAKWEGCVEDGIEHLRSFKKIYTHQSCEHMHEEARLYSFKTNPKNPKEILPIVIDKHNHCWDAVRYSLGSFIQKRGDLALWAKLAKGRRGLR